MKEKEKNKQQDPFLRWEVKAEPQERKTRVETKASQRGREAVLEE